MKAAAAATKAPASGYFASLALVGGAPAGAVLEKLLASPDAGIRTAAAETFRHGIFGPAALQALAKLTADSVAPVRQAAIAALALQANWRYPEAQKAIIAVATNPGATAEDRLQATDALTYAVRYQVKGVRQDPALFQALIAVSKEKNEPLRASASLALAPAFEPGPAGTARRRAPEGGWDKWLDNITATANAARIPYEICHNPATPAIGLFCNGGTALGQGKPVSGFDQTRQAAEQGYVPAQAMLGMLYATGKGTEQNFEEAGKWWLKAARGGDLASARFAWNLYRNGEGAARDLTLLNEMAALLGEPPQQPRRR